VKGSKWGGSNRREGDGTGSIGKGGDGAGEGRERVESGRSFKKRVGHGVGEFGERGRFLEVKELSGAV